MPRGKSSAVATPASTKAHKRQLSAGTPVTATPNVRSSKRLKQSTEDSPASATPKKSKYFEDLGSDQEDNDGSSHEAEESGYEDEEASATEAEPTEDEEEDDDEDSASERKQQRKRVTTKTSGGVGSGGVAGKNLWREGVKTGLGPGKQVFIEKPKPRGDGGVKYVPDRLHPNTMLFLADLKKNNDREWLKMHDPDYRQSWKDWESFVDTLSQHISQVDETVPELPPKDLVFRIYRDVRFSSDPTPYKCSLVEDWKKGAIRRLYVFRSSRRVPILTRVDYVQISPHGQSFVGAGLWMPEAQPLALLRQDIDRNPESLKSVLTDSNIRKLVFDGVPKDEKKTIKAFTSQNKENMLKTKPKGYEADNPNIELLRLRNFTMGRRLSEEEVLGPKSLSRIMEQITAMVPFVTYLNGIVMPDDENDSSDDEEVSTEANNEASSDPE